MVDIVTAWESGKAMLDVVKLAIAARDDAKIQQALGEMAARMTEIAMSALAAAEKSGALHAQLLEANAEKAVLANRLAERAMYAMHEIRPGAFAYRLLDARPNGVQHPTHYLCQPCYDKGAKAVLRYQPQTLYLFGKWLCPHATGHAIENTSPDA
jgi:hypothetical protein